MFEKYENNALPPKFTVEKEFADIIHKYWALRSLKAASKTKQFFSNYFKGKYSVDSSPLVEIK